MTLSKKLGLSILIILFILGGINPATFAYEREDEDFEVTGTRTLPPVETKEELTTPEVVSEAANSGEAKETEAFNEQNYIPGEVLVKYKNQAEVTVVEIGDGQSIQKKIKELKKSAKVEYAEPNYRRYPADFNTNDTHKDLLWGFDNINDKDMDVPEAWGVNEGTNASVIVAVIDTGVAYNHPDLAANMWDGSNCVDDQGANLGGCNHGYDFEADDKTPLPTNSSHGTHVAGTIAAVKNNNLGIVGVAPNAKIMALKFGLDVASEVRAIDFARQNGAKVINASFAGNIFSQAEYDAIARFRDAGGIFVTAAGNNGGNNESNHIYPSDYDLTNIISVTATDDNDNRANFANYGATSVDVGAPGVNIFSTIADSIAYSQNFDSLTVPELPSGWSKTGVWGTYNLGGNIVLYGDYFNIPYLNNANDIATSPILELENSSGAKINFIARCDTEYTNEAWNDYMALELSGDGTNFSEIAKWDEAYLDNDTNPDNQPLARLMEFNIPAQFLTNNFKFQFRWVTNTTLPADDGCLVDSVMMTKFSSEERYGYYHGTSMATSHVSGLAALLWGYSPTLNSTQIKNAILNSGDAVSTLDGKTTTGKRVNAFNALSYDFTDTVAPVLSLLGDSTINVNVGSTYTDPGATALDDVDGDITLNIIVTGLPIDTATAGTTTIHYNVSDAAGNPAPEVTRTVNVNTAPVVSSGGGGGGGGGKSSGGGGGGSSKKSASKKPVVNAPKTLVSTASNEVVPGCLPGYLFSPLSGKSCGSAVVATPAVPEVGTVLGAAKFQFTLLLKLGSRNNEVLELQKLLNNSLYQCGTPDGSFGPKTRACVALFQVAHGLVGDGIVGAMTRSFLNK